MNATTQKLNYKQTLTRILTSKKMSYFFLKVKEFGYH